MKHYLLISIVFSFFSISIFAKSPLQEKLSKGWNTWNTHNALSYSYLPDGFQLNLTFIQRHFNSQKYLNSAQINNKGNLGDAIVKPLWHTYDGSYTELEIHWNHLHATIETASDGKDLYILLTQLSAGQDSVLVQLEAGMLWNRLGTVQKNLNQLLAKTASGTVFEVNSAQSLLEDPFTMSNNPYLATHLKKHTAFYSGSKKSLDEIIKIVQNKRASHENYANKYGSMKIAWLAMQSCLAWNTVYDVKKERVINTVDRAWNSNRGGYVFFGWDNFFLSMMISFDNPDLAYANAIEALHEATEEGFISNNSQGNGRKAWDRSQPPVGSMMCMEIYKRHPQKWFLDSVYAPLLKWNRWWIKRRMNENLLSWGSHKAINPFHDTRHHDQEAAMLESGIDDSPMYEHVGFDSVRNILEIQDVGLNALYIRDCQVLAQMAQILGKKDDQKELLLREKQFRKSIDKLWNNPNQFYQNYRTDINQFSDKLSPTLFYPLIAKIPSDQKAQKMIEKHFYNINEFYGDFILPSISKNDPEYPKQAYWKGAIWPPMNYLVYLGLREYPSLSKARKELAQKSVQIIEKNWVDNKYVSENYSSITGTGNDPKLNSSGWYAWGGLMAAIGILEMEKSR